MWAFVADNTFNSSGIFTGTFGKTGIPELGEWLVVDYRSVTKIIGYDVCPELSTIRKWTIIHSFDGINFQSADRRVLTTPISNSSLTRYMIPPVAGRYFGIQIDEVFKTGVFGGLRSLQFFNELDILSTHTHTASQITDFTTAVDTRVGIVQPAVHTHPSSQITDFTAAVDTRVGIVQPAAHTHTRRVKSPTSRRRSIRALVSSNQPHTQTRPVKSPTSLRLLMLA